MKRLVPLLVFSTFVAAATGQAPPPKIPAPSPIQGDSKTPATPVLKTDVPTEPARSALGTSSHRQPAKNPAADLPPGATNLPAGVWFDEQAEALFALGETYKAEFDRRGAAYVPFFADADRNYPLHFAVRRATVAAVELAVGAAVPTRDGQRVTFAHGGLRTTYDLLPRGMEQMFWFDALPTRGELCVEVNLRTDLVAQTDGDGWSFANALGAVVYGGAVRLVGATYAADICQEVFVALWDHPERFDPARGNLRGLLVTIGRRRCIDHLRRHGRREATEGRATSARPVATPSVDEAAIALLAGQRLRDALTQLPEAQRQAIELAYFDGLSFREVAVATSTSEGTAKSRIRLGLQRLAVQLRVHEEVRLT